MSIDNFSLKSCYRTFNTSIKNNYASLKKAGTQKANVNNDLELSQSNKLAEYQNLQLNKTELDVYLNNSNKALLNMELAYNSIDELLDNIVDLENKIINFQTTDIFYQNKKQALNEASDSYKEKFIAIFDRLNLSKAKIFREQDYEININLNEKVSLSVNTNSINPKELVSICDDFKGGNYVGALEKLKIYGNNVSKYQGCYKDQIDLVKCNINKVSMSKGNILSKIDQFTNINDPLLSLNRAIKINSYLSNISQSISINNVIFNSIAKLAQKALSD